MKGYIYKITNLCNWKTYIGQTIQEPEKRFQQHKYNSNHNGRCIKLYRAAKKYGWEMFSFDVIAEVDRNTKEEVIEILNNLETYYIDYYDSVDNGYNISNGGAGVSKWEYYYLKIDRDGNLEEVYTPNDVPHKWRVYAVDVKNGRINIPENWCPAAEQVLADWDLQIKKDLENIEV